MSGENIGDKDKDVTLINLDSDEDGEPSGTKRLKENPKNKQKKVILFEIENSFIHNIEQAKLANIEFKIANNQQTLKEILDEMNDRENPLYYCKSCIGSLKISWSEGLGDHFQVYHGTSTPLLPLVCPMINCNKKFAFNDRELLLDHAWAKHFNEGANFVNEQNIEEYLKDHRYLKFLETVIERICTLDYFYCKRCKIFKLLKDLDKHSRYHFKGVPTHPLQCPVVNCHAKFAIDEKDQLGIHVKIRHLRHINRCYHCDQLFKTKDQLTNHGCSGPLKQAINKFYSFDTNELIKEIVMKNNATKFRCNACKTVLQVRNIDTHFHNFNKIDQMIPCPIYDCQALFSLTALPDVNQHILDTHINEEIEITFLVCPHENCNVMFKIEDEKLFSNHVNSKHDPDDNDLEKPAIQTESRNYPESNNVKNKLIPFTKEIIECLKMFTKQKQGEYVFTCKFCRNQKINFQDLFTHLNTLHVGNDATIECPIRDCCYTFTSQEHQLLALHIKTVHLNFKIKCRFCYQEFTSFAYRTEHEEKVHEIFPNEDLLASPISSEEWDAIEDETMKAQDNRNEISQESVVTPTSEPIIASSRTCKPKNPPRKHKRHKKVEPKPTIFTQEIADCLKIYGKMRKNSQYHCKYCRNHIYYKNIYAHLNTHHNNIDPPVECPILDRKCTVTFTSDKYNMIAFHIKTVHLNFKIECRHCSRTFASLDLRAIHEEINHSEQIVSKIPVEDSQSSEERTEEEQIFNEQATVESLNSNVMTPLFLHPVDDPVQIGQRKTNPLSFVNITDSDDFNINIPVNQTYTATNVRQKEKKQAEPEGFLLLNELYEPQKTDANNVLKIKEEEEDSSRQYLTCNEGILQIVQPEDFTQEKLLKIEDFIVLNNEDDLQITDNTLNVMHLEPKEEKPEPEDILYSNVITNNIESELKITNLRSLIQED